jgi:hypothetical protein
LNFLWFYPHSYVLIILKFYINEYDVMLLKEFI